MAEHAIEGVDNQGVNLDMHPTAKKLVMRCEEFFAEVKNLTPGKELEARLNKEYGPGNPFYEDFCTYVKQGLDEGWIAAGELDGKKYRRGKVCLPSPETSYFSITAVYSKWILKKLGYFNETGMRSPNGPPTLSDLESQEVYSGQYHAHPYGEINCVVQLDDKAELMGMQGWQGAGWTSPGPGTHHYPQVRGGSLVALFFLPAGRISYDAKPGQPQPHCV